MKHLIITAHPLDDSFTNAILDSITKNVLKDYTVINLYKDGKQEYLDFKDGKATWEWKRCMMQNKITDSDELILIFPIWWGIFPAVVKNFFDTNFLIWYAFTRNEDGLNIPLLKWKKISIFCTCNSPATRYERFLREYFQLHFVECCGMKLENFEIFWWICFSDLTKRKAFLEKIRSYYI